MAAVWGEAAKMSTLRQAQVGFAGLAAEEAIGTTLEGQHAVRKFAVTPRGVPNEFRMGISGAVWEREGTQGAGPRAGAGVGWLRARRSGRGGGAPHTHLPTTAMTVTPPQKERKPRHCTHQRRERSQGLCVNSGLISSTSTT